MSKNEKNVEKSFYLKNIEVNKIQTNLNAQNDMVLKKIVEWRKLVYKVDLNTS